MRYLFSLLFIACLSAAASAQSPLVFSIGTNHVTGEVAHYASLKAACDTLNKDSSGVLTADHLYYITSNLTEPANVNIGLNTNGHTITFKPYTGTTDTITFTQTADNSGASGCWVIGVKNLTQGATYNYGMSQHDSTENIVIDGSNTNGGTTRDLSIVSAPNISTNENPIKIMGKSHYITIKNTNVIASQAVSYAIYILVRNSGNASQDTVGSYPPHDILIDNCAIADTNGGTNQGQGIAIAPSGTPTQFPMNVVFSNNKITARTRGIFLDYSGNTSIYGNDIYVNQGTSGFQSEGIFAYIVGSGTDTTNIYDNKFSLLATANTSNTTSTWGIDGILIGTQGVYNVYNNTITNFTLPNLAQGTVGGIVISTPTTSGVTANVYYNSVYMGNTNTAGAAPPTQAAFYLDMTGASGTRVANVTDNIFVSNVTNYRTYAAYVTSGNLGTLNSDYNLLYAQSDSAKIGNYGGTVCTSLSGWQTASSKDAHSVSGPPQFVSPTDLHINLAALPVSAANNAGTAISGITTDAAGNARDASHPDLGAYEFTPSASGISTLTIAQAKVESDGYVPDHLALGDTLLVYGVVTSPNLGSTYTSYYIQDSTGGINVYKGGAVMPFSIGDSVFVKGKILQNKGLTEISPLVADSAHFGLIKHNATVPTPKIVSLHDYLANAESYEGSLVEIDSLYKSSGTWGANKNVYVSTSAHTDSTILYINSYTNVGSSAEPPYPINLVGVASQYTSSVPPNNGYEIIPRSVSDIGILTLPASPAVIALNGATFQRADTLILKWHPAAYAAGYTFQLSTNPAFSSYSVNDSSVTDTTETLIGISYLTKYYWHVRAHDAGGYSSFSALDSFTTIMQAPEAPVLFLPSGTGSPRKPTFTWHPAVRTVRYNLQVATDSKFSTLRENLTLLPPDTSIQISDTLSANVQYYWRVGAIDTGGTTYSRISLFTTGTGILGVEQSGDVPRVFALLQNYPNPFNPSTVIRYDVPKNSYVKVTIYDVLGRVVSNLADGVQTPGHYSIQWNASRFSSGVYFCRIVAQSQDGSVKFSSVKKLMLVK